MWRGECPTFGTNTRLSLGEVEQDTMLPLRQAVGVVARLQARVGVSRSMAKMEGLQMCLGGVPLPAILS